MSVSNCTNIQNIIWQGSSDGWNYTNIGSSTCVTLPLYNQYELYLRVTVTCAGGQTAFTDFMVVNCDGEIEPERPSIPDFTEIHPEIEVYPNPASSDITLFIKNVRDEPKDIFISNTFGVRTKINYNYDPISKSVFAQYNAELLSKGLHIITYYENNTIVSKKLMIHHE